ncbi:MAG TPA: hypothetical protein VK862_07670 [Afifellaceae bacterium]|nr:hypothetical protein [Afifellaceae bacterium]
MKLNLGAFALAFGIWWGGGVFLMTWWLMWTGEVSGTPMMMDLIYPGYSISTIGSLIGLAYGFVCGTISGGILAWLYNLFAEQFSTSPQRASNRPA